MFGSNKPKNEAGSPTKAVPSTSSLNSLVQGTNVEGKLKATSDIRVDGTIKGELFCDAKVIIGPSGVVEGTIRCENAVIEGRFEGTLIVKDLLNIRETAKVLGEVSYGKLNVQSGAVISGSYKLAGEGSNGSPKRAELGKTASGEAPSLNITGKANMAPN